MSYAKKLNRNRSYQNPSLSIIFYTMPQLDIVNLQNYIHDAEYPYEHNIRDAEIYARILLM